MQLYVLRHAQSTNNALYWETGSDIGRMADPPLTDTGHRQAERLARYLAGDPENVRDNHFAGRHNRYGFRLTHLYSSMMIRAVMTGSYVAEATGLPLVAWPEIHERGGLHNSEDEAGDEGIEGPNRAYFETHYPQLVLPDWLGEEGWWNRPRETVEEAIPRAELFWRQLLERHGETHDSVAIVTHGGFFQSLISVLIGGKTHANAATLGREHLWFGISNASVSRIELVEEAAVVRFINRVDFLPSDLITG